MYIACILYRNNLTSSALYAFFWYLPIAFISAFLFVTASKNPGYLDEHPEKEIDVLNDVEM